jgi:hypothetical protein
MAEPGENNTWFGRYKPQQVYTSIGTALLLAVVAWNVFSLGWPAERVNLAAPAFSNKIPPGRYTENNGILPVKPISPGKTPEAGSAGPHKETSPGKEAGCPFGNIDIHVNVGSSTGEIAMLHLAMESVDELMPCVGVIHIMFTRPKATEKSWEPYPPYNIALPRRHAYKLWLFEDTFFKDFPWDVKFKHQYARLTADLYVREEAEFILFMDSDTLLALPVTCRSLFDDEGKPLWFYGENSDEWGAGARAAIGINRHVFGSWQAFFFFGFGIFNFSSTNKRCQGVSSIGTKINAAPATQSHVRFP